MIDRAPDSIHSLAVDDDSVETAHFPSTAHQRKAVGFAAKQSFILSTIPKKHDINPFIELLKRDCILCVVGELEPSEPQPYAGGLSPQAGAAGSLIVASGRSSI